MSIDDESRKVKPGHGDHMNAQEIGTSRDQHQRARATGEYATAQPDGAAKERIDALKHELAELERHNREWWQSWQSEIALSIEESRAWYQEHKRDLYRNSRARDKITRELRKLEWPSDVDARLWRCLKIAGFETWKDVMDAIILHGIFWFGQFRQIGPKQLEKLEKLARKKVAVGDE